MIYGMTLRAWWVRVLLLNEMKYVCNRNRRLQTALTRYPSALKGANRWHAFLKSLNLYP